MNINEPLTVNGDLTVKGRVIIDWEQPIINFQCTEKGMTSWAIGLDMARIDEGLLDFPISKGYRFRIKDAHLFAGSNQLVTEKPTFAEECIIEGGYFVDADGISEGTRIIAYSDETHATLSNSATKTIQPEWCAFHHPNRFCADVFYISHNRFAPATFGFHEPQPPRDAIVTIGGQPGVKGQAALRVLDRSSKKMLEVQRDVPAPDGLTGTYQIGPVTIKLVNGRLIAISTK